MLHHLLNKLFLVSSICFSMQTLALPEDFDQEIIVVSDSAYLDRKTGEVIYQGNVELTQGTLKINADKLTVIRQNERMDRAIAEGKPARYQQQIQPNQPLTFADALKIEYLAEQREALLIGQAKLNQDGNILTGELVRYNMDTEVVSAGQPANKNGEAPSRIRVVIQPKSSSTEEAKK